MKGFNLKPLSLDFGRVGEKERNQGITRTQSYEMNIIGKKKLNYTLDHLYSLNTDSLTRQLTDLTNSLILYLIYSELQLSHPLNSKSL